MLGASIFQLQRRATCEPYRESHYRDWCIALIEAGLIESVEGAFGRWRAAAANPEIVDFYRSALLNDRSIGRAPDNYIVREFDGFAESFDAVMDGLDYRVPNLMFDLLARSAIQPHSARALDIGCGTGLCGLMIRPYACELVGVDLSGEMIKRASKRKIYDLLVAAEIEMWLGSECRRYDLVVAGDVLIYFGELTNVFAGIRRILAPDGLMAVTLEAADDPNGLTHACHGRFQHGRHLVATLLERSGFADVMIADIELRQEMGKPVAGFLVSARG